jgi:hypothetical protein
MIRKIAIAAALVALVVNAGLPVTFALFSGSATWILMAVLVLVGVGCRFVLDDLYPGLLTLVVLFGYYALWQLCGGFDWMREVMGDFLILHGDRAFAWFAAPSSLGCLFAMLMFPLVFAAPRRWLAWAGGLLCVGGLVLAGSKGALLAALAGGAMALWMVRPRARTALAIGATTCVLMVTCIAWRGVNTGAITSRLDYWHTAARMIAAHPVRGVGAGEFGLVYWQYAPKDTKHYSVMTHNDFLQFSAESGLWCGALYAGGLAVGVWRAVTTGAVAVAACLVAFGVSSAVDFSAHVPALAIPAALVGGTIWSEKVSA